MKVGMIGAGHVGSTLARQLTTLGHDVSIANSRGPDTLAEVAAKTGATPATVNDVVREKDMVIVTITEKAVPGLPPGLFAEARSDLVIVDTCNYYPDRDGRIAEIEAGLPESRWVERHLGRPVVKAFNNIMFQSLADKPRPKGAPDRVALPVAADAAAAKAVVLDLIESIGFDGLDAGDLDGSWRQQPGTPVYCTDQNAEGVRNALSSARAEAMPEYRRTAAELAAKYTAMLAEKSKT